MPPTTLDSPFTTPLDPPQATVLIGAGAAWLTAAELLDCRLPVVIIDPRGRWRAVASRLAIPTVRLPDDAINPLDFRAALGDVINPLALQIPAAAKVIVSACQLHGCAWDFDAGSYDVLHIALAAAYETAYPRSTDITAQHRAPAESMPTIDDAHTQVSALAVAARHAGEVGEQQRVLDLAKALAPLVDSEELSVVYGRLSTIDPVAESLHIDLSGLPASQRPAAMIVALDEARKRARPNQQRLTIVDDADLLFVDGGPPDYLKWLPGARPSSVPRLLTEAPGRMLAAVDPKDPYGETFLRLYPGLIVSNADAEALSALTAHGFIDEAEHERLRDMPPTAGLAANRHERRLFDARHLLADADEPLYELVFSGERRGSRPPAAASTRVPAAGPR